MIPTPYDILPTVTGDYEDVERATTGIFSLDWALGNPFTKSWGMPLRTIYELAGKSHVGKSTLSYFMSGAVDPDGKILMADFEGLDRSYLPYAFASSGFRGEIEILTVTSRGEKSKPQDYDNQIINLLAQRIRDNENTAGIFDSVSHYQPKAEIEGNVGDAFVGNRAKDMAQFTRIASANLRLATKPKAIFVVNHLYAPIGGLSRKAETAGGDVLKAIAGVRMRMYISERFGDSDTGEISAQIVSGQIDKLRFGGMGRKFTFAMIPGMGVHMGLSWMFDCFELGLAERGRTVKIGDTSYGYISNLIERARQEGNEPFMDFRDVLYEYTEKEHGYER